MTDPGDTPTGHRAAPRGGPRLRTDVVDVYVFRVLDHHAPQPVELLQLLRAGEPLRNTWQPVMGHVEAGETAPRAALRELEEETGLARRAPDLLGFWALEQVSPFYLAALDAVVLSPRFAVRAAPGWSPVICPEHQSFRWTPAHDARAFMWPGQRLAVREILDDILAPGPTSHALRLDVDAL